MVTALLSWFTPFVHYYSLFFTARESITFLTFVDATKAFNRCETAFPGRTSLIAFALSFFAVRMVVADCVSRLWRLRSLRPSTAQHVHRRHVPGGQHFSDRAAIFLGFQLVKFVKRSFSSGRRREGEEGEDDVNSRGAAVSLFETLGTKSHTRDYLKI